MYCSKCGKQIDNNARFCPECGSTVANTELQETKKVNSSTADRELVAAIGRLVNPINEVCKIAAATDSLNRSTEMNKQALSSIIYKYSKVFYFVFGVVGLFGGFIVYGVFFRHLPSVVSLLFLFLCLVGGAILPAFLIKQNKASLISAIERGEQQLSSNFQALNDICLKIDPKDMTLLPPSYRYGLAVDFIYKALINQRAMTMQEAVNLFEDQLYKDKMLSMQRQQIAQLKSIQTTSSISAAASTANLFINLFG